MANITAGMVKELRDKTDAGMMDCKKALEETNGDMEAAVEYLRKAGITKAEKRSARTVKEGKIYALVKGGKALCFMAKGLHHLLAFDHLVDQRGLFAAYGALALEVAVTALCQKARHPFRRDMGHIVPKIPILPFAAAFQDLHFYEFPQILHYTPSPLHSTYRFG